MTGLKISAPFLYFFRCGKDLFAKIAWRTLRNIPKGFAKAVHVAVAGKRRNFLDLFIGVRKQTACLVDAHLFQIVLKG